jgi:hypothetical protein
LPRLFLVMHPLVLTAPRPLVLTTLRQSRRRAVGRGRAVPSRPSGSEWVGRSAPPEARGREGRLLFLAPYGRDPSARLIAVVLGGRESKMFQIFIGHRR